MASSEHNSSTPHNSVLNSGPTMSCGTTDHLYSHKCQTCHHCPATPTQKVEKCLWFSLSLSFLPPFVFMGCGGIKCVKCFVEVFLLLVWVCWDITLCFFYNRPVKLHPKPALDTSQTCGWLDINWSTDFLFVLVDTPVLTKVFKISVTNIAHRKLKV